MNHTSDAAAAPVPARIRARVHGGALQRVTRMFAATLTDVFIESLQNSRRAGATRVRATVDTLTGQSVEGEGSYGCERNLCGKRSIRL